MRKTLGCLSILWALNIVAFAGPEAFSGKEMKQVAPAPPRCPSWTGFYIGAFGGYKFSVVDTDLDLAGDWVDIPEFVPPILAPGILAHVRDLDNSGAELGGLIGYNYQFRNWVLGGEVTGGYLWARDFKSDTFPLIPEDQDASYYYTANSFNTHYLITVGPRIGYAFCNWLPYITGGLAAGDLEYSQRILNVTIPGSPEHFIERGSTSETNVGWMVGGGLEYALTDHWRLRAQYQYIDLGDVHFHSSVPNVVLSSEFTGEHRAELREHNVSGALIFQF